MPKVLVAEDEALIAWLLRTELEAQGYEVAVFPDGMHALEEVRRGAAFDVLVTDLNMPRMRGEELIRRLRQERRGLPVVVMIGSPPRTARQASPPKVMGS